MNRVARVRPSVPLRLPLLLTLGLLSAACGGGNCDPGGELQHRTDIFFGRNRPDGSTVSEDEFRDFVATAVTPRFPEGLTVFDASGQYLLESGELVREGTKVIVLIHDGSKAHSHAIDDLREEYKALFHQESVLRVDSSACVNFN